jgi:hypothetical protein
LHPHPKETVVHDVRIGIDDSAVTAITIGSVFPDTAARESNAAIILGTSKQEMAITEVLGEILDFCDAEPPVERLPVSTAIRGPIDATVVPDIQDPRVNRIERNRVLIRVYAVASRSRRDV